MMTFNVLKTNDQSPKPECAAKPRIICEYEIRWQAIPCGQFINVETKFKLPDLGYCYGVEQSI